MEITDNLGAVINIDDKAVTPPPAGDTPPPAEGNTPPPAGDTPPPAEVNYVYGEDLKIDPKVAENLTAFGRKHNLSQAGMDELLKDVAKSYTENTLSKQKEENSKNWQAVRDGWVNELKADKEFGGTNFDETANRARRALKKFGDDSTIDFLEKTGYGDHAGFIRMLARVDKVLNAEANFHEGGAPKIGKSAAEVLFGDIKI